MTPLRSRRARLTAFSRLIATTTPEVREKIRGQVVCEALRIAAAERDDADGAVVARQRNQRDAAARQGGDTSSS